MKKKILVKQKSKRKLFQDKDESTPNSEPRKKKKPGRKGTWSTETLDDLVDIICENENHKRKLILTNVPNTKNSEIYSNVIKELNMRRKDMGGFHFTVEQTRNKLKKLVST